MIDNCTFITASKLLVGLILVIIIVSIGVPLFLLGFLTNAL